MFGSESFMPVRRVTSLAGGSSQAVPARLGLVESCISNHVRLYDQQTRLVRFFEAWRYPVSSGTQPSVLTTSGGNTSAQLPALITLLSNRTSCPRFSSLALLPMTSGLVAVVPVTDKDSLRRNRRPGFNHLLAQFAQALPQFFHEWHVR